MKKIIAIILAVSFISTINAQYLKSLNLNDDKLTSLKLYRSNEAENVKEPVLAGVLSFIVPGFGIGQMYNGQQQKAVIHIGITVLCFIIGLLGATNIHIDMGGSHNGGGGGVIVLLGAAALFTGNWVWSIVDAVVSANDINKKARLQKYRTSKTNKIKFGIGLDKNKKMNFQTVIYF